jgi:hypothetical protein
MERLVIFSKHALHRMKQQKISKQELIHELRDIPVFTGGLRWITSRQDVVKMVPRGKAIVVVTVMGRSKFKEDLNKGAYSM